MRARDDNLFVAIPVNQLALRVLVLLVLMEEGTY